MKLILSIPAVMENTQQLIMRQKDYFVELTTQATSKLQPIFNYIAVQKEQHIHLMDKIIASIPEYNEPDNYEDIYSFNVAPFLNSPVFKYFGAKLNKVDVQDTESVIEFAIIIEKEDLLLFHGLDRILREKQRDFLHELIADQYHSILFFQDILNEENVTADDFLLEALNVELLASTFYKKASLKAESDMGKRFFAGMAKFELNHFNYIKNIIESRNKGMHLEIPDDEEVLAIIAGAQGEVESNNDEIERIMIMAIAAEENAQNRYQDIANKLDDPLEKEIFVRFACEEKKHQMLLEAQLNTLRTEGTIYWH